MRLKARDIAQAFVDLLERIPEGQQAALVMATAELLRKHGLLHAVRTFPSLVRSAWLKKKQAFHVQLTLPKHDPATTSALMKSLTTVLSRPCLLEERTDTSIIGGAIVTVGDERFDRSVRRELEELAHVVSHSLPAFAQPSAGRPISS